MIVCVKCNKKMEKVDHGYTLVENNFGDSVIVRHGDLFRCEECGCEVLGDFGDPFRTKLIGEKNEKVIQI